MKSAYEIIKAPIVTEKCTDQQNMYNRVTFNVDIHINKIEIKRAVESIFNVRVNKVSTIISKGKKKRLGVHKGKRSDKKKAIISLAKGQTIDFLQAF